MTSYVRSCSYLVASLHSETPKARPTMVLLQRGLGVRSPGGPIEAPLIGREAALEEFRETLTVEGAALLCFYGEHGVGISRLLKEIAREARERGCATAHLDLAECRTPLQPGEGVVGQMSPFSRWARMRHFTFVQEELARHWPLVARELPFAAGGRALQPARTALPGLVHVSAMPALGYVWGHTGRRAMRLVARRNLERRLQAGSGLQVRLAEGRMSADRLLELAPLALALDLDDLTRRGRGFMRLVVEREGERSELEQPVGRHASLGQPDLQPGAGLQP
ncbi:MAG TPA: hypothetical protein VHF88_02490, partial [Thermoleophilaceae bacterium]|nr:hypothetical protein [Thermoleophilaceae bacterium]